MKIKTFEKFINESSTDIDDFINSLKNRDSDYADYMDSLLKYIVSEYNIKPTLNIDKNKYTFSIGIISPMLKDEYLLELLGYDNSYELKKAMDSAGVYSETVTL